MFVSVKTPVRYDALNVAVVIDPEIVVEISLTPVTLSEVGTTLPPGVREVAKADEDRARTAPSTASLLKLFTLPPEVPLL